MREYPQDFDTSVSPESRHLAIARTFAVWSGVVFLLIVFLIGVFIWSGHSMRMQPFLISINQYTGDWTVISENKDGIKYTGTHAMQEYVVGNFARRWFSISDNKIQNDAIWCKCDQESCSRTNLEAGQLPCLVCCAATSELYSVFSRDILADYKMRETVGETWALSEDSLHMHPVSEITQIGGLWHLEAVLLSNKTGEYKIEAYVRVGHTENQYPLTMGFHIVDFNSYVVNNTPKDEDIN